MKYRDIVKYGDGETPQRVADQFVRIPAGYEVAVEEPAHEDEARTGDYLLRLWQRRWLILAIFLPCLVGAVYFASQTHPTYTAAARLRLDMKTPQVQPFQEPREHSEFAADPVITHMNILQSPAIAQQVVAKLNFQPEPAKSSPAREQIASLFQKLPGHDRLPGQMQAVFVDNTPRKPSPATAEARMQERVDAFLSGLSVTRVPETMIVEARYTSPDPEFGARALNTLCDTYLQYNMQSKSESYSEAQKWLQDKMADVKEKLAQSEGALVKFTGDNGAEYMMLSGDAQDYFKQMEELRLKIAAVQDEYNKNKSEETKLVAGGLPDEFGAPAASASFNQLRGQLAAAEVELGKIKENLGPLDSDYKAAAAARDRLALQVSAERDRLLHDARFEAQRSKSQLDQLKRAFDEKQKNIIGVQQRLSDYNMLKREVDVNRDMYNNLLQKWREISISQSVQPADVAFFQRAAVPMTPLFKQRDKIVLTGILLGLALSIGIALLLDLLDSSLKSSDDAWRLARLQTLAHIPKFTGLRAFNRWNVKPELTTHELPRSAFAESIRSLRTATHYSFGAHPPRTLLITSTLPGEGKSTIASNLAVSLAQKGQRILLIDADLKKSALNRIFDIKNEPGLANVLESAKSTAIDEQLLIEAITSTKIPNLFVIPSGEHVRNPADLLDSKAMHNLLDMVAEQFDTVIIDSAPLLDLADTSVLAPHVDGILLVVRPGKTPRAAFQEVTRLLAAIGGRVLGVVMNNPKGRLAKVYGRLPSRSYGSPYWSNGYGVARSRPMLGARNGTNGATIDAHLPALEQTSH